MSEQELYELARERVDRHNRRWTLWAVDLGILIVTLAAVALLGETPFADVAAAIFLGWGGIFTVHTILTALAEQRASRIDQEVDKLRAAFADGQYEKPKRQTRLELAEDGELVDVVDWRDETAHAQRSRNS